ncbi:MAG: ShlB/FhaC/HecB family hemolysin secretion/activation protein, partial [Microbacteriaceae bacterium]|nr:ShlB/FhaC/HecB family hemolysin secretion/activation protein [Burkholderiaceae bacterium]
AVPPNAGTLLQQAAPQPAATAPARASGLAVEPTPGAALPATAPFEVTALLLSGNTRFDTATLLALVADAQGQRLTLAELDTVVSRITAYYRRAGYPLARALIPAQTITAGAVRIDIIEARFGQVRLDNRSAVSSVLLSDTLAPLYAGALISQASLDRSLLLLSDVPGVSLGALLKPGTAVGTADLTVTTEALPPLAGQLTLDNHGNAYTGRTRVAAGASWFNPLHQGDVLSASLLSTGSAMVYTRLGYEGLLNGQGSRVGAALSALRYTLGGAAADLQAHGTAAVTSLWLAHPLRRSIGLNLRSQWQFDHLVLRDEVDTGNVHSDRNVDIGTLTLGGDALDALLPASSDTWQLGLAAGRVRFNDAAAAVADAATAQAQGRFAKMNLVLAHYQALAAQTTLALTATAQLAQSNLDPSQKLALGGPYNVRAYPSGALSGDRGYTLSAELRHDLAFTGAGAGQWQAVAFVDSGRVTINQSPWRAGANAASLSGVGLGLNWNGPSLWSARASVAAPVGGASALAGATRGTRGWIELRQGF